MRSQTKISSIFGCFTGRVRDQDHMGNSTTWLGDVNGDGWDDLALASVNADRTAVDQGAVFILFLGPTQGCSLYTRPLVR